MPPYVIDDDDLARVCEAMVASARASRQGVEEPCSEPGAPGQARAGQSEALHGRR